MGNLALAWVLWVVLGESENDHTDVREDPVYGVCLEGVWEVLGGFWLKNLTGCMLL